MDQSNENNSPYELLPEEVWLKVLSFLDAEGLKTSSLVCKQWNELIGQSSVLMKKLPLYKKGSKWNLIHNKTKIFKRRYSTIKIKYNWKWNEKILTVIQKFSEDLRRLEIDETIFIKDDSKFANDLLSSLNKLEELSCETGFIEDDDDYFQEIKPIDSPHFKKLEVRGYQTPVLQIFKNAKLSSLKILGFIDSLDFIARQTELEELVFSSLCIDKKTYEIIFNNLPKLKVLDTGKILFHLNLSQCSKLRANVSIRKLIIRSPQFNFDDPFNYSKMLALISKVSNVEELVNFVPFDKPSTEVFEVLKHNLKKLKKVELFCRGVRSHQVFP